MAGVREGGDGHGLLLLRGTPAAAERSLRRGLVAVHVVPLAGWTGVCLADSRARSAAPYDVGLEVLAARPVGRGQRPAIGFFVVDGCAVVTVQPSGFRARQRWLVWQPALGVRRAPDLATLPVDLLLDAAQAYGRTTVDALADAVADPSGTPLELLVALLRLLGLPGEDLLVRGADPGASRVEPSVRAVRAFDALVAHEGEDEARR